MKKLFLILSILVPTINLVGQDDPVGNNANKTYPALQDKEFENGSRIVLPELTNRLVLDLACLGKVWGFLKYNHPIIAEGTYNWDFELFRFLPRFLDAKDIESREGLMLDWINRFGDLSAYPSAKTKSKNSFSKQNLDWISATIHDGSLQQKLFLVHEKRNQGEHFYLGSDYEVPTFPNEDPYSNMPFPDDGFRLLALYKYWNIIEYFFPYKHLTDKKWDQVLIEYIPTFITAKTELEYELAALKIIGEIHDTHANLWEGANKLYYQKGEYYPPFHVRFVENQLIVDDYFNLEKMETSGVKVGDIITHIHGKPVSEIMDSLLMFYPASNSAAQWRDMSYDILRSQQNEVDIEYLSANVVKNEKLTLYQRQELNYYDWFKIKNEKGYQLLNNNILYLNLALLNETDYPAMEEHLKNVQGVIIDVRNYPNFLMYSLTPYFQTTRKPFARFTNRNIHNPGEFNWTKNVRISGNRKPFSGKLIVLVNEVTQSLGEFTAMSFKATGHATVIGSQTAGADGRIAYFFLPGGLKTSISGRGVYYPNKTETQRIGIVPDIEVKQTLKGIQEGRDELIEKAIEVIEKKS